MNWYKQTSSELRVWLDDERSMPADFNIHAKTAQEAISFLETGNVVAISLDHDLGDPSAGTGYDVAKWIEQKAFNNGLRPLRVEIHTANPVGRDNIVAALQSAERYWEQNQKNGLV